MVNASEKRASRYLGGPLRPYGNHEECLPSSRNPGDAANFVGNHTGMLQETRRSKDSMFKKSDSKELAWNTIKPETWKQAQTNVFRTQNRIYAASKLGKTKLVRWLQKRLIDSMDARFTALHRVLTSSGKGTEGTDKVSAEFMKENIGTEAHKLCLDGKSSTIRRVWIPKPGKTEKRPLGIPTLRDRAKQALALLALEPEWEAKFEPNSYGFRKARSQHDAIEAIFLALNGKKAKWVFDADIKKCFDRISHEALIAKLSTFPEMERQVQSWLKDGVLTELNGENGKGVEISHPTEGTPQGGVISPLLANIALHGLEYHLKDLVATLPGLPYPGANRGQKTKRESLSVIRYADDFVISHVNLEILKICIEETKTFLAKIGLEISEEKSRILPAAEKFDFLGFSIVQVARNGKLRLKIYPSGEAEKRHQAKMRELVQASKSASARVLIGRLRPIVTGWCNYFQYCECSTSFHRMDFLMFAKLRAWAKRRAGRKNISSVMERNFPSGKTYVYKNVEHKDNWTLSETYKLKKGKDEKVETVVYLPKHTWHRSAKFMKVQGDRSYYDGNRLYWLTRTEKYGNPRHTKLLKRQNGKCAICNIPFQEEDTLEVDHIFPRAMGGKDQYINLQLLHVECHREKTKKDLVLIEE